LYLFLSPVLSSSFHVCWCGRNEHLREKTSACKSVWMKQLYTNSKYFHVIRDFGSFKKFICALKSWRRSDKNSGLILWQPTRDLDPTSCGTRV
jgi:hypothetical protein